MTGPSDTGPGDTHPGDLADRLAALVADNARLRRLLDETGLHDGLRHAFRDTLAMLRAVIRRSAEASGDAEIVAGYAAHLEGRLDAIARVRATADAFGEVDLHTLLSDTLNVHVVREGERATISGPTLRLRPKAAQSMALAAHELATNAIEHGSLGAGCGRVDVTWDVEPSIGAGGGGDGVPATATLIWKESGGSGVAEPERRGFGTLVLEEMLPYELGARTVLAFEPDGLRCTVRLPLTPRVGRLPDAVQDERADD